jgi:Zc3h12a-like Ribonuclease NYN domain/S1 RNA binding domain
VSNAYKVVVDGSNVATEGRTLPSLSQLDEAVQAFIEEHPGADVLVIVDSSFPNRIDSKDVAIFEAAYAAGEIITPPAGTTGRGDAFILKVADKLGATVFSNDSFQEFHGTYDWLFDKGRLVGGKPVPGLGWVFMPRTPVRGPKSRDAVREAKRSTARIGSPEAMRPMPIPKAPPTFVKKSADADSLEAAPVSGRGGRGGNGGSGGGRGTQADLAGTGADDVRDRDGRRKKRRKRGGIGGRDRDGFDAVEGAEGGRTERAPADRGDRADRSDRDRNRNERSASQRGNTEPINGPLTFINFISAHGIGTELAGEIDNYSSHGFYVTVGDARGYVPLAGLAIPMPRSAKEVVRRGETHQFVVASFDSARRGIELALVGTPAASEVSTGSSESSFSIAEVAVPVAKSKRGAKPVAAVAPVVSDAGVAPSAKPGRRGAKVAADSVAVAPVSKPAKASKPSKPSKPTKPTKPSKPSKAAKVAKAEKPAKLEKPVKAAKPQKPVKVTEPVKPAKVAGATKPVKSTTPAKAAKVTPPSTAKPTKSWVLKPAKATAAKAAVKAEKPAKVAAPAKPPKAKPASSKSVAPTPLAKAAPKAKASVVAKAAQPKAAAKRSAPKVAAKTAKARVANSSAKSSAAKPASVKTAPAKTAPTKKSAPEGPAKSTAKPAFPATAKPKPKK